MLSSEFMQRALMGAVILGIVMPFIGVQLVLKRWSSFGDSLSHGSLAGVVIGLFIGLNPVFSAVVVSVILALMIELLRKAFPQYAEISTTIVMSLGVGLTALFSGLVPNSSSFSNFLYGSIVSISSQEIIFMLITSVIIITFSMLFYMPLFYISFDEIGAKMSSVHVDALNLIFTIMTAVVIALSSRMVGALVTSSILVLPVASAMQFAKSYKSNYLLSIIFSTFFMLAGLAISYYVDIKPSAAIVLLAVLTLLISIFASKIASKKGIAK